ncbi:PTS lactose transporter subunit IIB [Nonomuraea sp. K274]|uniref:PTS lactose transporter subunit IIB n=1 Tax=Nonomuraea cypriaca TaxID=1187855 RepID=A0A931AMF6_9ACTN|nr:PTS lactose transporter subunit IIB [Nonomuraea cypriaca]MBF8191612.1 PTS lactose transporter subunit IIB [Nonomuraea cypriaca]
MASIEGKDIKKIVIACDAGMGSSVMLASTVRKQLKDHDVEVVHTPVNTIPADADVVLCHSGLAERARKSAAGIPVVPFRVFIGDPAVTKVVNAIKNGGAFDA